MVVSNTWYSEAWNIKVYHGKMSALIALGRIDFGENLNAFENITQQVFEAFCLQSILDNEVSRV